MKRRILAILLACMMVVSVFPMTAFAEGEHEECVEHTPGEHKSTVEAGCATIGYDLYTCADCGHFYATNLKEATGEHKFTEVVTPEEPASCTATGTTAVMQCENCDAIEGGEPIDMIDHTPGEKIEGTCGGYICTACGNPVNDSAHVWSEHPAAVNHPTDPTLASYICTVEGCTGFKHVRIECAHENIAQWGSVSFGGADMKACDGSSIYVKRYQCEGCGLFCLDDTGDDMMDLNEWNIAAHALQRELARATHEYEIHAIESTCYVQGAEIEICAKCGVQGEISRYLPTLPHLMSEVPTVVAPTCLRSGYDLYVCEREGCNYSVQRNFVPNTRHTFKNAFVGGTCVDGGYMIVYCANAECDEFEAVSEYVYEDVSYVVSVNEDGEIDPNGAPVALNQFIRGNKIPDNHVWTLDQVTKEATCEGDGAGVRYCANCDLWQSYRIPGGHVWSDEVVVAPTCTAEGYTTRTCETCGEENTYNTTVAHGANYKYATYEDAVAEHPGLAEEGEVLVAGDCEVVGVAMYACADCSTNVLVVIPDTGSHAWDTPAAEATCTTPATVEGGTCTKCGETKDTAIDGAEALGHNYVEESAYQAGDCTTDEVAAKYVCDRCGEVDPEHDGSVITPAPGHNYEETDPAVEAKCGVPGSTAVMTCTECGDSYGGDEVEALSHAYENLKSRDANCTEFGYKYWACAHCGDEYITNYVPELGHTEVTDEAVETSCTAPGLTEGKHCETCGEVLEAQEEIEQLPHQNAAGDTLENKCTNLYEDRFCVNGCEGEIANDHHTALRELENVPATCTEDGYTITICEDCWTEGDEEIVTIVKALGHDMSDWIVDEEPTVEAAGKKHKECSRCDYTEEDTIPALAKDLAFAITVDNVNASGKGYTDSSLISVTIAISAEEGKSVDIWGLQYELSYDADALTFVGIEQASDKFAAVTYNAADGVVKMIASTADGAATSNATITDEAYVLATLQFRVTTASGAVELTAAAESIDADGYALNVASATESIDVEAFMDVDANDDVNLADLLAAYEAAIAGEYNVVADVDKSGALDFEDILNICEYLVGAYAYEDMTALGQ